MKKLLALVLALVMGLSLVACGNNNPPAETGESNPPAETGTETQTPEESTPAEETTDPDSIPDSMTSEDGTYQVAFVTDVGQLKDKSFNQGTFDGVKLYAAANGLSYKYYQPANGSEATDEDRYNAMKAAADAGAEVIVCAGYLQEAALRRAAMDYPDIPFVFIDGYPLTEDPENPDSAVLTNVAGIAFKEEQAGYLAGYAAVKDGFTELGFLGGMAVPAVIRYGYGFVQGADAAAQEMGANIHINYWYGGAFSGDANITAKMESWYSGGTQVVFACGGGIYTSAVEAAVKYDGKVIGVDVDQNYIGVQDMEEGKYDYNPFVTSAMKGLNQGVTDALDHVLNGTWSNIAGTNGVYGLQEGDYIGLPTVEGSWNFSTFTVEEYEALREKIRSGEITVDNSSDDATKPTVSANTTVDYQV